MLRSHSGRISRLTSRRSCLRSTNEGRPRDQAARCLITGDEDGVTHCAISVLYSLQHVCSTIPPPADPGWIGSIVPGPSYLDLGSGGPENDFTNRTTTLMSFNLVHVAARPERSGAVRTFGNQRSEWEAECQPKATDQEHR